VELHHRYAGSERCGSWLVADEWSKTVEVGVSVVGLLLLLLAFLNFCYLFVNWTCETKAAERLNASPTSHHRFLCLNPAWQQAKLSLKALVVRP
jgi:hypothetical protein